MVSKRIHCYFPHDTKSETVTARSKEKLALILSNGPDIEISKEKVKETEDKYISHSYLIRCLAPQTLHYLEATKHLLKIPRQKVPTSA